MLQHPNLGTRQFLPLGDLWISLDEESHLSKRKRVTAQTDPNFNETDGFVKLKGQTPAERDMRRKDHTDTIFTCEFTDKFLE